MAAIQRSTCADRRRVLDGGRHLEHQRVDAVGHAEHQDAVSGLGPIERAREQKARMGRAGAPDAAASGSASCSGDRPSAFGKPARLRGLVPSRMTVDSTLGATPALSRARFAVSAIGRRHGVCGETFLPLAREAFFGQAPDVEYLDRRRGTAHELRDGLGVVAGDEGDRGVAPLALADPAGRADDDVGCAHERTTARGGEVETESSRRQAHARRAAQLDRGDRLGQVERGLDGRGVELLRIRRAQGGEQQRIHVDAAADRIAGGLYRHRHRVLVEAGDGALALARADRGTGQAKVGDVASVADDAGHAIL